MGNKEWGVFLFILIFSWFIGVMFGYVLGVEDSDRAFREQYDLCEHCFEAQDSPFQGDN